MASAMTSQTVSSALPKSMNLLQQLLYTARLQISGKASLNLYSDLNKQGVLFNLWGNHFSPVPKPFATVLMEPFLLREKDRAEDLVYKHDPLSK